MTAGKLRPFGELFKQTWEIYTAKLDVLLILFILPFLANLGAGLFNRNQTTGSSGLSGSIFNTSMSGNSAHYSGGTVAAVFVAVVIFVLVSLWIQAATIFVIDSSETKPSASDALAKGWPLVLPMFVVALLTGLAILGGLILLIIPGIIFAVWFIFSNLIVVLEGKRGTEALKASKSLVTGRWGAVFGRFVLLVLSILAILIVIGIVAALFRGLGFVVSAVFSSFLITPLEAIFLYVLYKDLKANPQLAEAKPAAA